MSSSAQSLTDWNEQFGDFDLFPEKQGKGGAFEFEMGTAYPCRITKALCTRSKFGDLQVELSFDIQASDEESDDVAVVGKSRIWLDLPKQPSDLNKDKALVIKLTQRRYQNLLRILSAAAPAVYALYAERRGSQGSHKFIDFEGQTMDSARFDERKRHIHSLCVDFADKLSEGEEIEIMLDTLLYIEKRTNPRNEKYPYVNYYARKPEEVKVYSADSDAAPF